MFLDRSLGSEQLAWLHRKENESAVVLTTLWLCGLSLARGKEETKRGYKRRQLCAASQLS